MKKFNLQQKISAPLAFVLVLILGFCLAWYSLAAGERIIENSKRSASFNLDQRMQNETSEKARR